MRKTTSSTFKVAGSLVFPLLACAGVSPSAMDAGAPGALGGAGGQAPGQPPCLAGQGTCSPAGVPLICDADGVWREGDACPAGTTCAVGACVSACELAKEARSYQGCEYWATPTSNTALGTYLQDPSSTTLGAVGAEGFPFAVAIANPGNVLTKVTVEGGRLTRPLTMDIPAGGTQVAKLPWVLELVGAPATGARVAPSIGTRVVARGGYRITSDAPIVAYQFNPLTFSDQRRTGCSPLDPLDDNCFSFSNDASLLLPAHTLGTRYTVVAWPTQTFTEPDLAWDMPGFVTIVASEAGDTEVSVTLSSYAAAGVGTTEVFRPGETVTRTLRQGDVFQILSVGSSFVASLPCEPEPLFTTPGLPVTSICRPDKRTDLTGTVITSSVPVAVFAGHDCAFVPYNRYACDHLEEQLFPDQTWGTRYVVSPTVPQLSPGEPTWVRVMSGAAGNRLTFTPPVADAPAALERGEYFDFQAFDGVVVEGTGALAVVQYLVGQQYWSNDKDSITPGADPAMVLEVPIEQWRTRYDFYVPATYVTSFVNVVIARGAEPRLNGGVLPAHTRRPVSSFDVLQIDMSASPGPHRLEAAQPFALKVYGFAPFTSYVYPGGLDLRPITIE
jgi:hypothetical protein